MGVALQKLACPMWKNGGWWDLPHFVFRHGSAASSVAIHLGHMQIEPNGRER